MSDWPFLMEFVRLHARERLALATLVACEGSSYRPPGARLVVRDDGCYYGSLSGGCLEQGIATVGMKVIATGLPQVLEIDTRPHFGCPGVLRVFVEAIEPDTLFGRIADRLQERQTFRLVTSMEHGTFFEGEGPAAGGLVEVVEPPVRLLAIGWTSDMAPVLQMSALLGWERHRLLRDARVAEDLRPVNGEKLLICPPDEVVERFVPDERTAVLIMTHHLATDLAYLKQVFPHRYGYLGLLGSRRRRETLLAELGECGLLEDESHVARFHGPVGLDLGGGHPSVIALAIVGEIQAALAGCSGGFLRDRAGAIHLPAAV